MADWLLEIMLLLKLVKDELIGSFLMLEILTDY